MAENTKIEWTDASWTPLRARDPATGKTGWHCFKTSPGCAHCYSETFNGRGLPNGGTGLPYSAHSNAESYLDERILRQPLKWRKPRRVFPCSMTDLFGDWVKDEWIDRMFAIMSLCRQHTFQVLTKRSDRMRDYCNSVGKTRRIMGAARELAKGLGPKLMNEAAVQVWPLPNVWLGVSVENQKYADERIIDLINTLASVRFLSCEPLLGPIDLTRVATGSWAHGKMDVMSGYPCGEEPDEMRDWDADPHGWIKKPAGEWERGDLGIDWVIVGGESGPKARECNSDWVRDIVEQCKASGTACFVKQLGANVATSGISGPGQHWPIGGAKLQDTGRGYFLKGLQDKKGGDWTEWPEDLRVRQFPETAHA